MSSGRGSFYSDECGGQFTAHYRESTSPSCGHKTPFTIRVTKNRKTVWAPSDPLCVYNTKRKNILDDIAAFFDYNRCGQGRLDGVKKRRRRRK